ncbi:DUF3572 domain-containing protein [Enterovirga sp.]|uniref:DUF3572 domain-containing protein n=1 Tax=Enterovirga sp. TaxID=2026350 RepID=UPI002636F6AD|nr:DUF3572 domain-containing protein [Enterovirga sp.]MDB5590269.1 hypothetical protein [Enterovirga sp.]
MKGESLRSRRRLPSSRTEAEGVAVAMLNAMASSPERLGPFLAASGLDPSSIRRAAAAPGFLVAVLDHVAGDEPLLLDLAGELDIPPDSVMAARRVLSPEFEEGA